MNCANHPDRERLAFCQNCGKPLCQECIRTSGTSVFCDPCFVARTAAGPAATGAGAAYGSGGYTGGMPRIPGEPNPALAALLGFIPGVGAMYNEQYAKGVVHLVIFAVLESLSHEVGMFHALVVGWVIYQVFEAYHTARARRDGTPLPNPFGLNEIGERFGFGSTWAAGQGSVPPAGGVAGASAPVGSAPGAAYVADAAGNVSYTGGSGMGTGPGYTQGQTGYTQGQGQSPTPGSGPSYGQPASGWGAPQDWSQPGYGYQGYQPIPPIPPVSPGAPYPDVTYTRRFPTGAIWLIGIGVLFLLGNIGTFRFIHMRVFWPLVLIGIGVWVFVQRMTSAGGAVTDDGSPDYGWRLMRAVRSSVWIVVTGCLWLLDSLRILSWSHSWPLLLIVAGLLQIFKRSGFGYGGYPYPGGPGAAGGPGYPGYGQTPPAPVPTTTVTTTEIITAKHDGHDQEQGGR
jgi:Domain of unknown function (DUF5668)/B-box zinc finger